MPNNPFMYVKGGFNYVDLYDLPDFAQFARLDGWRVAIYPAIETPFYFIDTPDVLFLYSSRIINYFDVNRHTLGNYKAHIQNLGYINYSEMYSKYFSGFIPNIQLDILLDFDFVLDQDGIFMYEDNEEFRWLLIGRSIGYDQHGILRSCVEFRMYSLSRSGFGVRSIFDDIGILNSPITPPASQQVLPTPNALDYLNIIPAPSGGTGMQTPNPLIDVNFVPFTITIPSFVPIGSIDEPFGFDNPVAVATAAANTVNAPLPVGVFSFDELFN
jgi:hypothetical protein